MTNPLPEPRTPDVSRPAPAEQSASVVEGEATPAPDRDPFTESTPPSAPVPEPTSLAGELATPVAAPPPAPDTPGRLDVPAEWQRVSPKAVTIELLMAAIEFVVIAAGAVVGALLTEHWWPWLVGGALTVILILTTAFVPRRIRAIGYLLREDDLLFRRGIMWQRFVAVPYGRMQLVDINRGPLARAFGLAELKFVTASPSTGVTIPGLPLEEAERLRDHLVSVAESRRTGL